MVDMRGRSVGVTMGGEGKGGGLGLREGEMKVVSLNPFIFDV